MIKCPHCGKEFSIGSIKSEKKAEASRNNGKKGGRPKGIKNKSFNIGKNFTSDSWPND